MISIHNKRPKEKDHKKIINFENLFSIWGSKMRKNALITEQIK